MKYLFYLGHPAHYHNLKHTAHNLAESGHEILWVARDKDVLFDLLKDSPFPVIRFHDTKKDGKLGLVVFILKRELKMLKIAIKNRPSVMAGTDIVITHIGRLLGIPSVIINEDDAPAVPQFAKMGMKYCNINLAPESCNVTPYEKNTIKYKGYQELAYLSPKYFTPDFSRLDKLHLGNDPFFIIRLADLRAYHDDRNTGLTDDMGRELVSLLSNHGRVFITSERPLKTEFEKFRITIPPSDIHHALYFAQLYVGDSQTMTAEAAVLGTPAVRMNDFVGRLGYLEELEHTYQLTFGINPEKPELLLEKVKELLQIDGLKEEWNRRRQRMLDESIDVTEFFTNFFRSIPQSLSR